MRKLMMSLLAVALLAMPMAAQAGFVVEGSLGYGAQMRPSFEVEGQSLMLAPGYALLGEVLRLELGLVLNRSQLDNGDFHMQLRPMLVIDPPILPFYVRGIVGFDDPFGDRQLAYGAALGVGGSVLGLGLFAEAAYLPRFDGGTRVDLAEARVGGFFAF